MKRSHLVVALLSASLSASLLATLGGCSSGGATTGGTAAGPSTPTGSPDTSAPAPSGSHGPSTAPPSSGTGGGATNPGTSTDQGGDKLTGPYVLVFKQTGGIAALRMETTIDTAAKKITYGGVRNQKMETRDLTADEIATLTRAIDTAKLSSFSGTLKGAAPADAFSYEITIREGSREHTLKWADGAQVPAAIEQVQTTIARLRDSKFKAGGGSTEVK